jgi:hypothetical protein
MMQAVLTAEWLISVSTPKPLYMRLMRETSVTVCIETA